MIGSSLLSPFNVHVYNFMYQSRGFHDFLLLSLMVYVFNFQFSEIAMGIFLSAYREQP